MKSRFSKEVLAASFLALTMLGASGCGQSPDTAHFAQAAPSPDRAGFRSIADAPVPSQEWGKSPTQGMVAHPFVFKTDKKLKAVALVGSFNGWNKTATPMTVDADGLTWHASLPLAPGRYVYKFVPFAPEEGTWVVDPNAPHDEMDKVNDNSLLMVVAQPFVWKADKKLTSVALVGSFNGWDKKANPMVADADGLTWRLSLPLPPGRYVYKFAPFAPEEQTWVVDPKAPHDEMDKVNDNSVLLVKTPDAAVSTVSTGTGHLFVFKASKKFDSVRLVGSFNKWDKTANLMVADADGLTWRTSLPLAPGRYVYKFAQFGPNNEETWVVDPKAPLDETDKVNDNSVLIITPVGYDVPASPTDGITATSALLHRNGARDVSYDAGRIALSLRARSNDVSQVWAATANQKYPMKLLRSDEFYSYYGVDVPWNRKQDLNYHFELKDGNRTQEFGTNGLSSKVTAFKIASQTFQPYLLTSSPQLLKMEGPLSTRTVAGPSWAKNQPIYEVNLDVYKFPTGTAIREYEKQLPALKELGVGLVWFMPLYPRGHKKGFGSPYAVRDYTDINPDLGTKADFKHLVETAHRLGLRVLMDWVPNHTAWDNAMIEAHPEFYIHDANGQIVQAYNWADTAQLDYGQSGKWNQPLWNLMRDNMVTWVRDFDIDGFRCDVAGSNGRVPVEFWRWLRPQLNAVKPVFMLAETDDTAIHPAFDMTYDWKMPPVLWDVCAGRKPATAIDNVLRQEAIDFPVGALQMRFVDNHDWHAHADWGWGDGPAVEAKPGMPQVAPLMVLNATLPGKPLLYNGQEMSFVKTDPSAQVGASGRSPVWPFYRSLLHLYATQPALSSGSFSKLSSNHDEKIYAFTRQSGTNRVLVVVNLGDQRQTAHLQGASLAGNYTDGFNNKTVLLTAAPSMPLEPWAYRIYTARG